MTILISCIKNEDVKIKCDEVLSKFVDNLKMLNMKINPNKCKVMKFTINGSRNIKKIKLSMDGIELDNVISHKILGITIDHKLNFNRQINEIIKNCQSGINILKVLSGPRRGANPRVMLRVFNAIILSRISYGAKIINLSQGNIIKLQILQNKGIRSCLGFTRSAPITAITAEAGLLPIELYLEKHTSKYILKLLHSNQELSDLLINGCDTLRINTLYKQYEDIFNNIYLELPSIISPTNLKFFDNLTELRGSKAD